MFSNCKASDIATYLRQFFEKKYGGIWTALVVDAGSWGVAIEHVDHNGFITFNCDKKSIALFQVAKKM